MSGSKGRGADTPYTPTLNNVRGILWMLLAVTSLTGMFAIIKEMAHELPILVVAIMRTIFALVFLTPWLMRNGLVALQTRRLKEHFLRSFFGIASFACVIYAVSHLLLADAMVLAFTSPFWSILVSMLVLGEVAGPRRIVATIVGFLGVLMIVKPQGGIEPAMMVALGSALLTCFAMITMKRLSATEPPTRIVYYFFLFGTLVLLGPAAYTWQTPSWVQFAWLFVAGFLGAFGQDCLARAYDAAEVTVVAPFDFMRLPIAAMFGFVLFDEIPDSWSIAGTLTIIAAALYIARREARLRRSTA